MNDALLLLLVFAAVAALAYGVTAIVSGVGARRLRSRLDALADSEEAAESVSAIRARYRAEQIVRRPVFQIAIVDVDTGLVVTTATSSPAVPTGA